MNTWSILVVGNYPADQQQSMIRFAELLFRMYRPHARVRLICPPVLVTRLPALPRVAHKYLAYIDKLLLFPFWLALVARSYDLIHIADHSNAFYAFCCSPRRCLVTCHDLLAVRGAMGESSAACSASAFGLWLQRLIMAGLRRSGAVAFDSQATYDDFLRLGGGSSSQRHAVIPIPLNAPFTADAAAFRLSEEEEALLPSGPYLLMVGSALPRKNRALALQLVGRLGPSSPFRLVLAGEPFAPPEQLFCDTHPLGERLLSIPRPSHALLNRLYCLAHALLFPSLAEGFGWPLLEAQACGCPVIASSTTSIPEVAGAAALYADPLDVATFAAHVLALQDHAVRARLIQLGHQNLRRFAPEVVSAAYRRFAFQA